VLKSELTYYIDNKIQSGDVEKSKLNEIKNQKSQIILQKLPKAIEALRNTTFKEPVQPRVLNIVNQNRTTFLRQLETFLEKDFEEKFDYFMQNNIKLIGTLKHLYFDETSAITNILKELAELKRDCDEKIAATKLKKWTEIRNLFEDIDEEKNKKKLFANKTFEVMQELDTEQERNEQLIVDKELFEKSKEYRAHKSIQTQQHFLDQQMRITKDSYEKHLNVLEYAIKKFTKLEKCYLIKYLSDPLDTMSQDYDTLIKDLICLKQNLNKLQLKPNQEKEVFNEINWFTEENLKGLADNYKRILEDMKKVQQNKQENTFLQTKKAMEHAIHASENKVTSLKKNIENYKNLESNISHTHLQENINKKLEELGVEVCENL